MSTAPHRRAAAAALAAVTVLALSGCSEDPEPEQGSRPVGGAATNDSSGDPSGSSTGFPATSEVELLEAGTGTRRQLELEVDSGHVEKTSVEITMTTDIGGSGQLTIPVSMPFTTTVTGAESDRYTADVVYGKASVDTSGLPAVARPMISQALDLIEGTTARVEYARNGILQSSELELGDDAPDLVARLLDNIASQSFAVAVPLPEEEVGVGARWRAATELEVGGASTTVTSTYTLTELTDDGYTVTVVADQESAPGDTPAGKVLGGSTRSTGTVTGRSGFVAPVRVESSSTGTSAVEVGGQEVETSFEVTMELTTR
ncbi:hypothetical protein ASE01_19855 [Nocardioides sp. Root190]|uniref:DUF6263 family protein n=1 Tax=Nocardioides sp. Root190 TaxID=1736488 RepID=UPI0006FA3D5E|nr:DUF6263 family protein [Nocardioides sp. Root190]KRB73033.1 hypothetical protein ASE01_19855 [Nocardioides sp. Root190]